MSHARGEIRTALSQLVAGISGLEDHVTVDLARITTDDEAPWAYVWLSDETVAQNVTGKKSRELTLNIDLMGRNNFEVISQLEVLAAAVERRVDADPTLNRLVGRVSLQGYTITQEFDNALARLRMIYTVFYWTAAGNPATAI